MCVWRQIQPEYQTYHLAAVIAWDVAKICVVFLKEKWKYRLDGDVAEAMEVVCGQGAGGVGVMRMVCGPCAGGMRAACGLCVGSVGGMRVACGPCADNIRGTVHIYQSAFSEKVYIPALQLYSFRGRKKRAILLVNTYYLLDVFTCESVLMGSLCIC